MDGRQDDCYFSLVLSGGISLGGYMAGAVSQIGYFVTKWNETANDRKAPKIFVDVVSGASAGALTGAQLVRHLGTFPEDPGDAEAARNQYVSDNFEAWCGKSLSFTNLLDRENMDSASFLSNSQVEATAKRFIPGDSEICLPPGQDRLIYTCTLTSLDPLPMPIKVPAARLGPEGESVHDTIIGKTRRDVITFRILRKVSEFDLIDKNKFKDSARLDNAKFTMIELASTAGQVWDQYTLWDRLRDAAVASGSFPFTWSPWHYPRYLNYWNGVLITAKFAEPNLRPFVMRKTYTDGGTINNMPLDRAAHALSTYARDANFAPGLFSRRSYILIEPGKAFDASKYTVHHIGDDSASEGNHSVIETDPRTFAQRAKELTAVDLVGPLFEAIREQSFFSDLEGASKITKQLERRAEKFWPILLDIAKQTSDEEAERRSQELNGKIVQALLGSGGLRKPADLVNVYAEREDVIHALSNSLLSPAQRNYFLRIVVLSDVLSGFHYKHAMSVLRISATKQLASAFLGAFGGFVKQSYMARDFHQGLLDAREALEKFAGQYDIPTDSFFDVENTPVLSGKTIPEHYDPTEKIPMTAADADPDEIGNLRRAAIRQLPRFLYRSGLQGEGLKRALARDTSPPISAGVHLLIVGRFVKLGLWVAGISAVMGVVCLALAILIPQSSHLTAVVLSSLLLVIGGAGLIAYLKLNRSLG